MLTYIALRDRRLIGGVPNRPHLHVINTNKWTRLRHVFTDIRYIARRFGRIHAMFVLCHGYGGRNEREGVSMDAGGMGLELGREDVRHTNVYLWDSIKNTVENIVVYSCAASNTEIGNEYTTADGRYLMGALAIHTNADVYAADRIQWYVGRGLSNRYFDFGAWEGQLWHFPPTGANPCRVDSPPVEFADVVSGTAP
jgi:hypothetical protein